MGYLPTLFAQTEEGVSHLTGAERLAASEAEQASLFADLEKTSFDDPGRMVLPPQSRRLAGIEGQALFIGAGQTFQIWKPETYIACEAIPAMDRERARLLVEGKA
nr:division/cell wall cluster transcriptional repressor MraZ [Sphingomonas quercus]